MSKRTLQILLNHLHKDAASMMVGSGTLTARETEILSRIANGELTGAVAEQLNISNNTVAHHVKSIYHKLAPQHRAEGAAAAINMALL